MRFFDRFVKSKNKRNGIRLTDAQVEFYAGRPVFQKITSEKTSRNQIPRIDNMRWVVREYIEGKEVVDLAIGKWPENVMNLHPNVVPRDPYNQPRDVNIKALRGIYDTAIISNTLNVIDDDREIISLLELAKILADTTLITVYGAGTRGKTRDGYQRGLRLDDYLPFVYQVFGKENVTVRNGVIICEAWR
ncbi:MAG: hypothetical protein J5494_05520 [Candidatus Methanomethylophilaceae archaeon]|nr:hypothetical protein [Candidatus Methanomethylophilaceae archaeon]